MTYPYDNNRLTRRHPLFDTLDPTETLILKAHPVQVMDAQALAPQRHPVGLNVRQDVNYPDVLAFVKQMGGVKSMLFHCDRSVLPNLRPFLEWVDIVIWRPRPNSGEMWVGEKLYEQWSPVEYVDRHLTDMRNAGYDPRQLWLHLHNEPGWSTDMLEWEQRATEHAISMGAKVILLNQAVGNPHETLIHMARPLLKLAGEHPESVIVGCHEYMSVWGNRSYPWYLGRWQHTYLEADGTPSKTKHSFESYRHSVKELKDKPVRYLVTEWGADHLSDDEPYTNTLPKTKGEISGVHTLSAVWTRDYDKPINPVKGNYPGLDTAYFQQLRVAWETGQYDNPEMVGALIYGWGKEWPLFDISGMSTLHEKLAEWRPTPLETQPDVAEFNLPYSAVLVEGTNLRTLPTTDNKVSVVRVTVKADTLVTVREPVKPVEANGYTWFKVRADVEELPGPVEGWMAKHRPDLFKKLADGEPPPADPKPEEPDDTTETPTVQYITIAEAQLLADASFEKGVAYMKEWVFALLTEYTKADADAQLKKIALLDPTAKVA